MRRREFVATLGGAAAWPLATRAQQSNRVARVGRLSPLSEASERAMINGLRLGLRELGWIEGTNLALELRFANGQLDKLPALAADLIAAHVDVIVTGSTPGALAAKWATDKVPVVFVTTGDPISGGLVPSLRRPGGNLTGVTALGIELNAKRLELLKEAVGGLSRVAVLANPGSPYTDEFVKRRDEITGALGLELLLIDVRAPSELAAALDQVVAARVGGVLMLSDIMFITYGQRIAELVAARRVPAIYPDQSFVDVGGLMFYGAALPSMYKHAAVYVDKILRGAKPAELPVEQPTTFALVINNKTARAMGLDIPPTLLARADEVIE